MINNPMTEDDYKTIVASLKLIQDAIPWVQKAENCGVDCQRIKEELEENRKKLEAFKANYFKNGKPIWMQGTSTTIG